MMRSRGHSTSKRWVRGVLCTVAIVSLVMALDGIGLSVLGYQVAHAGTADSALEEKADWQGRYRRLLQRQARLRDNAAKSRENYARAQRRNYPRGGARQLFILDAEAAEAELVKVEAETEGLLEQARREALPRNWFYEVDDEGVQLPAAKTSASADQNDSREGRNPLYFDK